METFSVFSVFTLLGGLAFFLYGMNLMSHGLEKMAGGKLEKILKQMTSNPFKSLLLGAGITIAIQSSSAMTVMLVGLVNSGIMQLSQTVGVIMGSNIGTTLTAWIFSLAGIESENFFIRMLKPESFSPIIALIGVIMTMIPKKRRFSDIGHIFIGFAVLMYGMVLMSDSVSPLRDIPEFTSLLTAFKNPLLGVLVGTVFTGIIQSSAASVGILQALSMTGLVSYQVAIPIIMGQNIGTCVTALISSIGVNKNARRVSIVHISFNVIGTAVIMTLYYSLDMIFNFAFSSMPIDAFGIAMVHSIFNVFTTLMLLPFSKLLVKIANFVIRDKEEKESFTFIDERLLNTPAFAISECTNATLKMAEVAKTAILDAVTLEAGYTVERAEKIREYENDLDMYEDKLGAFLVKLASRDLTDRDSRLISMMLQNIGDFERIGDHALNLVGVANEKRDKSISFSTEADREIAVLTEALNEIVTLTTDAFVNMDTAVAAEVEPLEQVIDGLIAKIKLSHIERLRAGNCTIELGFILSDLLTNYERVSDHCSNIAVAVIELDKNNFESHEYLSGIKEGDNEDFGAKFKHYSEKYQLEH